MARCEICGVPTDNLAVVEIDYSRERLLLCSACTADLPQCVACRQTIHPDDVQYCHVHRGEVYCETCYRRMVAEQCHECEEWYGRDEMSRVQYPDGEEWWVCCDCRDSETVTCEDCGETFHYSMVEDGYCLSCYHENHRLYPYDYSPEPDFHGMATNNRYYGLEIEVDCDRWGKYDVDFDGLMEELEAYNDLIYCKYDGSLHNGVEIVTHPCSYQYLMEKPYIREICQVTLDHGYRSHHTTTCGLHVHISKDGFGEDRELGMAKFVFMIEKFWHKMVKFSRRNREELERWASRYCEPTEPNTETVTSIYNKAKDINSLARYKAVNMRNADTVEVRMFKGTLRIDTIKASIQLLDIMVDQACIRHVEEIQDMKWHEIEEIARSGAYPELSAYLDKR